MWNKQICQTVIGIEFGLIEHATDKKQKENQRKLKKRRTPVNTTASMICNPLNQNKKALLSAKNGSEIDYSSIGITSNTSLT